MTIRIRAAVLVAPALLWIAGCNSNGGSTGGGDGTSRPAELTDAVNDKTGQEPLPGKVQIARIERAANGDATYYLDNISNDDLSGLSCRINFFYDPTNESAIQIATDRQPSPEQDLYLAKGEKGHVIAAANARPGARVLVTNIEILEDLPVAVTAREGGTRGSMFLNKELESVAISSADDLIGSSPSLWIEVENISGRNVPAFEALVIFVDPNAGNATVKETPKTKGHAMGPGERQKIAFDLSGLGRLSSFPFLFKVHRIRKF